VDDFVGCLCVRRRGCGWAGEPGGNEMRREVVFVRGVSRRKVVSWLGE